MFEIEINGAPLRRVLVGARTPTRTVLERGTQKRKTGGGQGDGALRPDGRSLYGRRGCLRQSGAQTGSLTTREGKDHHGERREGWEKTLTKHTHTYTYTKEKESGRWGPCTERSDDATDNDDSTNN